MPDIQHKKALLVTAHLIVVCHGHCRTLEMLGDFVLNMLKSTG